MKNLVFVISIALATSQFAFSQIDEEKAGAWYMYFFNGHFPESRVGFQGDIQYRNWNLMGDLEQLLLRGGVNFQPEGSKARFTLGYAHITSGVMGEGTGNTMESRIYQEALLPHNPLSRVSLAHRFRFEQRFVEEQDFRTRFRYALFMNIPLNKASIEKDSFYFSFYNEIFINGEREIGDGIEVELYDRNRTYVGAGYGLTDRLRVQVGWMHQVTDNWSKGQLQVSLHHQLF
jgi:hypothetical protein